MFIIIFIKLILLECRSCLLVIKLYSRCKEQRSSALMGLIVHKQYLHRRNLIVRITKTVFTYDILTMIIDADTKMIILTEYPNYLLFQAKLME